MVKSVVAEPKVKVFPASSTEPTVKGELLVIVVSALILRMVLLPVVKPSSFKLPAASRVAPWERLSKFRKPTIAAVSGYALGGGCEILLHSNFVQAHVESYIV